ncbi:MAG: DUF1724 domain-containing protein [Methanobrevibacter sp.]|uniref:helix-turn-helix transcriptional regulator n=1 Tax=Methanobrevibacter sp. TaxID=66852 RepID=UPI0025F18D93|nr:transcriptional regulator FilR1 domain-containing protein [Methanobrevibacter sp.]MBR0271195.1 DUF1724 domain-containing protein [Methanobrevibacter sp.]
MMIDENYIDKDILFIVNSEIRLQILTELKNEPQTVRELVDRTNMAYSSVSNNLSKLEYKNHVIKEDRIYTINPMTRIYFDQIMEFKKSIDVVQNFNNFWYKHDITYININLIEDITKLYKSKLIETNPIDIYKTHNNIKKNLEKSRNVKGILPYIHPEYPKLMEKILKSNGKIELIMEKSIYRGLISQIDEKVKRQAKKEGRLKIHVLKENLEIYLLICDNKMNLGLFKNDGSYDQNRILTSDTHESINWANSLFDTIKEKVI